MTPLLLSIASASIIFVIFKLFRKFNVDTFQAIVINYFTAFACGILLYGNEWNPAALNEPAWIFFAILCAILFISLFWLIGKSSQENGVATTSIAVKMSMAFSLLLMIVIYTEPVNMMKVIGILLAFFGIYFVTSPADKTQKKSKALWMLIILFIGSGVLDFSLNFIQKEILNSLTSSLFSSIGLGMAGVIGLLILIIKIAKGSTRIEFKNIIAGVILGIPNYFSIYLLMKSYQTTGWSDSSVLAVTNVSVVMISAITGFIIFSEKTTLKRVLGLLCAILAITILALNP